MKIKICGMRDMANIDAIASLQPDYLGFIFYDRSKRFVSDLKPISVDKAIVKKVGVFVNAEFDEIESQVSRHKLDVVQLHGNESSEFCAKLNEKIEVWKAFGIDADFDWELLTDYEKTCSHFLLDTKTITYGGSGRKFDWNLLRKYKLRHPLILSGGLKVELLNEALELSEKLPIDILDMNSGIELEPGLKDVRKAALAIKKVRSYELSS